MKVLYFAWLKQKTGIGEETVAAPPGVRTVGDLIDHLRARDAGHAAALADLKLVRVAVNQEFAELDTPVGANDEIAFFPPVTGG
ncbi:MAG: molybdopterin converting factor subunit 1 [Alphaproteobacteria bacterium]